MDDGGWNCAWDSVHNRSTVGSVHTTISVLEAFADYEKNGYDYRPDIISFHYPCRWKYDCFRALEYFVHIGYPYDNRMQNAINLVKTALKRGYINRGKSYSAKFILLLNQARKEDLIHTEVCLF
ncbi:hypothetical protein SDC9_161981 [bioreactor metagenome]|uniref:Uncharacterized protein n=1 Tax=bioreactor metagenome TaxID=1076179 RepID=A0A645FR13_9ZZZZ|nr:hypothetical protein [Clostridiaceae bacterium]